MNKKTIALFSGGLDSILAARIVMEQGIRVIGINFIMEFASRDLEKHKRLIRETARQIGMESEIIDISNEYLKVLENPMYGFGANINPCIDCKIFMLRKAKKLMGKVGASFVITGEVLGERPMSQRKDALNAIENNSGLKGYILRPLSAKLLKPTIPEEKGLIKREKLFDIKGRSRKPQLELARRFGITKFFTPAGGCLLTDPAFSRRLKDLIGHNVLKLEDIRLLKFGRHFRFNKSTKFILGRDEEDNRHILNLRKEKDLVFEPRGYPGPIGILRGERNNELISLAASFLITHTKKKTETSAGVRYWVVPKEKKNIFLKAAEKEKIEEMRI
ncbi:MAG: tRNA 4-thiouridine(8) synthase ThiI [Candidatus Omnitrophica bacterium]|nr:tRNA 4-thiouridine(8) synthase ThiI [Candidatus Omnitrophota bacterium]